MIILKSVSLDQRYNHGHDPGAKPGYHCKVELQLGDKAYQTANLELSADATKRVLTLIGQEAMAMMTLDFEAIEVEGSAGVPKPASEVVETFKTASADDDHPL